MVTSTLQNPQVVPFMLGAGAMLVFLSARVMRFGNRRMALLSATIFGLALHYVLDNGKLYSQFTLDWITSWFSIDGSQSSSPFNADPGAYLLICIALGSGLLVSIYSGEYLNLDHRQHAFYPLLMLMMCGLVGFLTTTDLVGLFLFVELMSICAYALVAFRRQTDTAIEAGFKYLMMGSTASILILAGIGFLVLTDGHVHMNVIRLQPDLISQLAILLMLCGFCLKCALVPLHTWLPDAHGRAPSSISAILSGIMVQGVFYGMLRVLLTLGFDSYLLGTILLPLSWLNIIVGNTLGMVQTHTKRLLGYSTIAQTGYIVLCVAIGLRNQFPLAIQSAFLILIIHAIAKSLAFLTKGVLHYYLGVSEIKDLPQASRLSLFPTLAFLLALLTLAAIPPFAGFTGKWVALTSIVASNDRMGLISMLILLAGSLLALGYYFPLMIRLASQRWISPQNGGESRILHVSAWMMAPMAVLFLLLLWVSLSPQWIISLTHEASLFLIGLSR